MAQFAVFLISFLVKLITQTVYVVTQLQDSVFIFSTVEVFQRFFLNFIPILFMLFCHQRAYSAHEKTNKLAISEHQTEVSQS